MASEDICSHMQSITALKQAKEYVCEECLKIGSDWVHLRTCQTCGVTLCCDQSPHQHMTGHYHHTGHPVIISSEPGESWMWCYPDKLFAEYS